VHWLGTVEAWLNAPPKLRFADRVLLSTLNPISGSGSFYIFQNRMGVPLDLDRLTPWLDAAMPEHHLLAVHSLGADAYIEQGAWQLHATDRQAGVKAAGAVLLLRARNESDQQDFARAIGTQITASSYEFAYPADQVISGRLWPVAQRPPVWMSRLGGRQSGEMPWLELKFDQPRSVERIRLIHASAAGWSDEFNPGIMVVELSEGDDFTAPDRIEIRPQSLVTAVQFSKPQRIRSLRVEFLRPGGEGLPVAAKLMGLQVLGQ
jgi:hypothetical protein